MGKNFCVDVAKLQTFRPTLPVLSGPQCPVEHAAIPFVVHVWEIVTCLKWSDLQMEGMTGLNGSSVHCVMPTKHFVSVPRWSTTVCVPRLLHPKHDISVYRDMFMDDKEPTDARRAGSVPP